MLVSSLIYFSQLHNALLKSFVQEGFSNPLDRGVGLLGGNELTLPAIRGKRLTKNNKITLIGLLKRATYEEKVFDITNRTKQMANEQIHLSVKSQNNEEVCAISTEP